MRSPLRFVLPAVGAFVLAVAVVDPGTAHFQRDRVDADGKEDARELSVSLRREMHPLRPSEACLSIDRALDRRIPMPFRVDTPVADVLVSIQSATAEGEDAIPGGLPIYVDEAALHEVERSLQEPIRLDREEMPLGRTLPMVLDQVGLVYTIRPEGCIVVTTPAWKDAPFDPSLLILDELRALRADVERAGSRAAAGPVGGRDAIRAELDAIREELGRLRESIERR